MSQQDELERRQMTCRKLWKSSGPVSAVLVAYDTLVNDAIAYATRLSEQEQIASTAFAQVKSELDRLRAATPPAPSVGVDEGKAKAFRGSVGDTSDSHPAVVAWADPDELADLCRMDDDGVMCDAAQCVLANAKGGAFTVPLYTAPAPEQEAQPVAEVVYDEHHGVRWLNGFKPEPGQKLYAAPAAEQEARGWRTMESAPRDGTEVLICFKPIERAGGMQPRVIGNWRNRPNTGWYSGDIFLGGDTWFCDWMPLPAPPAMAAPPKGEKP